MKYSIFKLIKVCAILLLVTLVATTLYYQCSKQNDLLNSPKSKVNNVESSAKRSDCMKLQDFENERDRAIMKVVDSLVVDIATAYINDNNANNPNNNTILSLIDRTYCNAHAGEMVITPLHAPVITDLAPKFSSDGIFKNITDITQTMPSDGYAHSEAVNTTTAFTRSWGVDLKGSTDVGIPFTGTDVDITLEFSFNNSSTESTSKDTNNIYTVPSMNVIVPPHKKYELISIFSRQNMHNEVLVDIPIIFTGILFAQTPDWESPTYFNPEQLIYNMNKYDPDEKNNDYPYFTTNNKGQLVYRNKAYIEATYGTKINREIKDITDPKNPITIKTLPTELLHLKK